MRTFATLEDLRGVVGQQVGVSEWLSIDQDRVALFADATEDHQWIHLDVERARAGPFGQTIAHGYLTLALVVPLMQRTFTVEGVRMAVNYGLNRVRFPAPVPVGSRIRARVSLTAVEDVAGGVQATWNVVVECEGSEKPVCVAESLSRLYV